ncbi:VQ motif-containing protein 9-like [Glycine soja]|uniref:VQ motif-containing protein 9 n=1 Tax=Glycine soja TaxID=3848 RepID=A0A445H8E8_GLYSO|nr:VQ motif-containing protein 9-like [Glycine soja]RZB69541.1 VQ motif-containing protein 9 [Glycine soja]
MDHKHYQSPLDPSSSFPTTTTNRDHYLKQLNKFSHNISKPNNIKKPTFVVSSSQSLTHNNTFNKQHALPAESQPQVYNISKNDFRDMVQKLTGSPGHSPQPKPVSTSRLHRLRPPPLPQVFSNRPPPPKSGNVVVAPPSPLPPFPTVHAESPVSAYMRSFLRNSVASSSESEFQIPFSPVTFGCINSLVPLSPTVPVSSPGWRDL